jgi:hypothetical protein
MKWPKSETELAAPIVRWLADLDWDVYQEVQHFQRGCVADIVATQGPVTWVVEVKRSLSIDLINQAYHWLGSANRISVATPHKRRKHYEAVYRLLRMDGIGHLEVAPRLDDFRICVSVPAVLHRRVSSRLRDGLCEGQKTYAAAGNANGSRWSPFRETCENVRRLVEREPGITMREMMISLEHHYSSLQSAKTSLAKWINRGKVRGVRSEVVNRRLCLFPDEIGEV